MSVRPSPLDLIDPFWRRLHPGRRVLSMLADIVAWASFIVGGFWLAVITPLAPADWHVEAEAQSAAALALGACLWGLSSRLYPNPWFRGDER